MMGAMILVTPAGLEPVMIGYVPAAYGDAGAYPVGWRSVVGGQRLVWPGIGSRTIGAVAASRGDLPGHRAECLRYDLRMSATHGRSGRA